MKLITTRYTINSEKFSEQFKGCRIAMLSDLHDTIYGQDNSYLVEKVISENPDIIIIAGDLVTAKKGRDYLPAIKLLKKLAENIPIYYGYGNHEQKQNEEIKAFLENVRKISGVTVLDNETCVINDTDNIRITGLSIDKKFYKKGKRLAPNISDIIRMIGTKKDDFTILIAHNPIFFDVYEKWNADVVFSGHLHGGIVRLPFVGGVLSPQISFFPKYDKGLFEKQETKMIVSAGLGKHTIPVRIFNPAELVVVDLKNKN